MNTSAGVQIAKNFGMEESLDDIITARRLRWLGHVARMEEVRIPRSYFLGGYLSEDLPMVPRDRVRKDL